MRTTTFLMKRWPLAPQNENKVPFKEQLPLHLKNRVTSKGSRQNERGCLYEISLVLACLEKNNYDDQFCTKEVTSFHKCYSNYLINKRTTSEEAHKGILKPNSTKLKYNQLNILMRRYPHV